MLFKYLKKGISRQIVLSILRFLSILFKYLKKGISKKILCFSVRFCDNSLLVLQMRFHVYSLASKKLQGFSSDRAILMLQAK